MLVASSFQISRQCVSLLTISNMPATGYGKKSRPGFMKQRDAVEQNKEQPTSLSTNPQGRSVNKMKLESSGVRSTNEIHVWFSQ